MSKKGFREMLGYGSLLVFGITLLCVAIALFANREAESVRAGRASASILSQLDEVRPKEHQPSASVLPGTTDGSMPVQSIGAHDYVGSIAIPSLKINLPVAATTSDECLLESPCRYNGSYFNDDLIICGEGYRSHFGGLGLVGIRDDVLFVAADGALHSYVVSNVETRTLESIDAVVDDWDLTLFTFNGNGTCCVVRCIRAR